jgi:metal-responsive CopG/Arc/MetJ family transcriptional regulator
MSVSDPTVRMSVTVPSSLYADLEAAISAGKVANRSQAVSRALRPFLDAIREQELREAVSRLSDEDSPDEDYAALRSRT